MVQRHRGRVVRWNDERGFGFIQAPGIKEDVFLHISALRSGGPRPALNTPVSFALGTGKNGQACAADVEIVDARVLAGLATSARPQARVPNAARAWAALLILALLFANVWFNRLPAAWAGAYLAIGAVSFWQYWSDKRAARAHRWRTSEMRLHLADICFGILGGLLAQQLFRHKTRKTSFRIATWIIAGLHVALLLSIAAGVLSVEGSSLCYAISIAHQCV